MTRSVSGFGGRFAAAEHDDKSLVFASLVRNNGRKGYMHMLVPAGNPSLLHMKFVRRDRKLEESKIDLSSLSLLT